MSLQEAIGIVEYGYEHSQRQTESYRVSYYGQDVNERLNETEQIEPDPAADIEETIPEQYLFTNRCDD
jgi:hypothetical protein